MNYTAPYYVNLIEVNIENPNKGFIYNVRPWGTIANHFAILEWTFVLNRHLFYFVCIYFECLPACMLNTTCTLGIYNSSHRRLRATIWVMETKPGSSASISACLLACLFACLLSSSSSFLKQGLSL